MYSTLVCVFFIYIYLFLFLKIGGGITERNLQRILEGSGAEEFHCSARSSRDSAMKFRFVLKPALNNIKALKNI